MEKTLEERVNKAFLDEETSKYARDYLAVIRDNMRGLEGYLRRSIPLFILLVFTFEFILEAMISEITLGPFKFGDISVVYKLLPAVIAYYFFDILWSLGRYSKLEQVHTAIIRKFYPILLDTHLDRYLTLERHNILYNPVRRMKTRSGYLYYIQLILNLVIF